MDGVGIDWLTRRSMATSRPAIFSSKSFLYNSIWTYACGFQTLYYSLCTVSIRSTSADVSIGLASQAIRRTSMHCVCFLNGVALAQCSPAFAFGWQQHQSMSVELKKNVWLSQGACKQWVVTLLGPCQPRRWPSKAEGEYKLQYVIFLPVYQGQR